MSLNSNNLKNISKFCLPVWQIQVYREEYEGFMIATRSFHNASMKHR